MIQTNAIIATRAYRHIGHRGDRQINDNFMKLAIIDCESVDSNYPA